MPETLAPAAVVGLLVLVAALLLAWHLTYTAARLDRLHTRAEGALSALDGQLVRRAEAAHAVAASGLLDPAAALALAEVAGACLDAAGFAGDTLDEPGVLAPAGAPPVGATERSALEGELSATLREVLDDDTVGRVRSDDEGALLLDRLAATGLRVRLARRFHADAVEDAVRVRALPLVRVFRLAGHAARPEAVDLDDRLPAAIESSPTMGR